MIIIGLGNKVYCGRYRDDIFKTATIKINRKLLLLEFCCLNELINVVKCSELKLK